MITGVPGAGKTAVKTEALKGTNIKDITFSSVMMEIGEERNLDLTQDGIRNMDHETYKKVQADAAKRISEMEGEIALDTHLSIKTPYGYYPGFPIWALEHLKLKKIIIIDADSNKIMDRRQADTTRERSDFGGIQQIEEQKNVNLSFATAYSMMTGAYITIIQNNNTPEEAGEKLREVLS